MDKKLIVANWKMNGSKKLCDSIMDELSNIQLNNQVVICPPLVYLDYLGGILEKSNLLNIHIGAQNCSAFDGYGSYTGDVSCNMLSDLGIKYIILGHSERRRHYGEVTDILIKKLNLAINNAITPILCLGSDIQDSDVEMDLLSSEIELFMEKIPDLPNKIIVAYEPLWAIGTGLTPKREDIYKITKSIQQHGSFKIIYGGSVSNSNAGEIIQIDGLSGLLIGGASLEPKIFREIIEKSNYL